MTQAIYETTLIPPPVKRKRKTKKQRQQDQRRRDLDRIVRAVQDAQALRDECRAATAQARLEAEEAAREPWRRVGNLFILTLMASALAWLLLAGAGAFAG